MALVKTSLFLNGSIIDISLLPQGVSFNSGLEFLYFFPTLHVKQPIFLKLMFPIYIEAQKFNVERSRFRVSAVISTSINHPKTSRHYTTAIV